MQLDDLLLGDLHLLQAGGDLLEGQEPPLLAFGDQRAKLVDLHDRRLAREQCFGLGAQTLDPSRRHVERPRLRRVAPSTMSVQPPLRGRDWSREWGGASMAASVASLTGFVARDTQFVLSNRVPFRSVRSQTLMSRRLALENDVGNRTRGRPVAGPDAARLAVARGRDERREGHPDRGERHRAALLGPARLLRRSRAAAEGRAHVALRGGRQRRDRRGGARRVRVPRRDAGPAHRREGARPPGRPPRRGAHRGALPGAQAGARVRDRDAGDLLAARRRGGVRGRHAAADRRAAPRA